MKALRYGRDELRVKYVNVSQSNDNCLLIQHLFAYLAIKDKSLNLSRNSSCLIGWKNNKKD